MASAVTFQHPAREFSFTDQDFHFLAALANERTGIVLNEQKRDMVYGRLARRLRALNLQTFADYCALLRSDRAAEEMSHLVDAITTNLTSFFREGHHFDHLKTVLEEAIALGSKPGGVKRLRLWSSACSSGMEPYSMAMVLHHLLPVRGGWDAKILATDIDNNMVATARAGEYTARDVEPVPAAYKRYLQPGTSPGTYGMHPEIRELISFKPLNLLEPWPMKGQFDAVFCRNVVIYFNKETKVRLFARMAEHIRPEGWLYIGHSENLHGITERFELKGRTMYRRMP